MSDQTSPVRSYCVKSLDEFRQVIMKVMEENSGSQQVVWLLHDFREKQLEQVQRYGWSKGTRDNCPQGVIICRPKPRNPSSESSSAQNLGPAFTPYQEDILVKWVEQAPTFHDPELAFTALRVERIYDPDDLIFIWYGKRPLVTQLRVNDLLDRQRYPSVPSRTPLYFALYRHNGSLINSLSMNAFVFVDHLAPSKSLHAIITFNDAPE